MRHRPPPARGAAGASATLAGLSRCAGLVLAPKTDDAQAHRVRASGPGRALVVLVTEGGLVENRVIDVPLGMPPSTLRPRQLPERALIGRTLDEARTPYHELGARRPSSTS